MKLNKVVTVICLGLAALVFVAFALDLAIGIPFGRSNIMTNIFIILAAALMLWQGIETWFELR